MHSITIKTIAAYARLAGVSGIFCLCFAGLSACGSLRPASRPQVYDLGPGAVAQQAQGAATLPAVVLADVDAPPALDGTAVVYRLAYSDAQQLRPYAQARWSMPPAQLLRQRLRQTLAQQTSVMREGEVAQQRPMHARQHLERRRAQAARALVHRGADAGQR